MDYNKSNLSLVELEKIYHALIAKGESIIKEMEKIDIEELEKESLLSKHRDLIAYRSEVVKRLEKVF